jgi:hypothetical protein
MTIFLGFFLAVTSLASIRGGSRTDDEVIALVYFTGAVFSFWSIVGIIT